MQANLEWAQMNFGTCELGDKRRTRRLVEVAAEVANNPSASFPDQMPTWSDLKAAYHLFDCDDVTFEAIARPHWEQTKQRPAGRYLVIGDTTVLDFERHRDVPGPTGNGGGLGLDHDPRICQSGHDSIVSPPRSELQLVGDLSPVKQDICRQPATSG